MRLATFVLALAALVFACTDFWQHTLPLLTTGTKTREDVARRLDEGLARVKREGAPPTLDEVTNARATSRELARDLASLRSAWYAEAERGADYLVPRAARSASAPPANERERIAQALLALPAELKLFPGLSLSRLGLRIPSLTESVSSDAAELADQAERAVAVRHLIAALRAPAAVRVENGSLQRTGSGLVLRLDAITDLTGAVALFERLLGESDEAPPRKLRRLEVVRQEPREWGLQANDLPAPPVRVSFALEFDFPSPAGAAQ